MGRRKVLDAPALASWEDVDQAMRQVIECDNQVKLEQVAFDRAVQEAKDKLELDTRAAVAKIKMLGAQIKQFTTEHREELGGKKTKQLTFGKTGFRLSTSCVIPKGTDQEVVAKLRTMGLADCINTKETVNRDNLKQKDAALVEQAGCRKDTKDVWWYEVDHTKLPSTD